MTPFEHQAWEAKADAGDGMFAVALALVEIAHAINSFRPPLQGETLGGIQDALDGIALAIDKHRRAK
jgi:hypothetical protein